MNKKIIMSIDSSALNNPSLLNLDGIKLDYSWLKIFTNAEEFREYINKCNENLEIWVVSNDDIEAINLAATAKKDRSDCIVCLVSYDMNGSLKSRAEAANIDSVLSVDSLKERLIANIKSNETKDSTTINNTNEFKLRNIPKAVKNSSNQNKAFVISVLSASGGVGKSSVSIMCGLLCQAAGLKTLIIDADFQFGDLEMLLGARNALKIDELMSNRGAIAQLKPEKNIPCLLAPPTLPEYAEKIIEDFPAILENLKEIFDVIVVNTGSFWNEQQALLLERDSKSLFLVDQRPSSIASTKKAINLCSRCGIATGSVLFVINKCSKHALFSSVDVSCALDGAPVAEILDGGLEVDEFMSSGEPFELLKSRNLLATSLWNIIESILPKNILDTCNIYTNNQKKRKLQKRKRA